MRIVFDSSVTPALPMSIFLFPVLRLVPAEAPKAMLPVPPVRLKSASGPSAVLSPGYPPSGDGSTAWAAGESANSRPAKAMTKKPRRKGERFIEFVVGEVFVFIKQIFQFP